MVATMKLDIDGDRARARTILFNPMVHRDDAGQDSTFFIGLWYRDELVRTAQGWRISARHEDMAWSHAVPPMPPVPALEEAA